MEIINKTTGEIFISPDIVEKGGKFETQTRTFYAFEGWRLLDDRQKERVILREAGRLYLRKFFGRPKEFIRCIVSRGPKIRPSRR